jgi:hypothetical protein
MNAVTTIADLIGVLAAGIIYGTDVFCALVRPRRSLCWNSPRSLWIRCPLSSGSG